MSRTPPQRVRRDDVWSKYKSVVIFIAGVTKRRYPITGMLFTCLLAIMFVNSEGVEAQPTVVDPRLDVRTVVSGLSSPTTMAFLGDDDILVLEKETGKVQRVMNGTIQSTVLDLPVNFGSERGFWELHYILPFQPTPASTYTGRRAQPATILRCSARLRCSETEWTASFGTVLL